MKASKKDSDHAGSQLKQNSIDVDQLNNEMNQSPNINKDLNDIQDESDALSYKEVSEMSEITQESFPEGYMVSHGGQAAAIEDLVDFEKLKQQTLKKLKILDSEHDPNDQIDIQTIETADEFLRNFFIKFGMKKTLDNFQQEWFELKTKGELNLQQMPQIPEVYQENIELSNILTTLQKEVDEARTIAEKSRSTYDKLRKQRDFQKINHRRVQQEKQKLNHDIGKLKKKYEEQQNTYEQLSSKYESAIKEKMLMKLEKDRLVAKVDNLEASLQQIKNEGTGGKTNDVSKMILGDSPTRTHISQISKQKQSPQKTLQNFASKKQVTQQQAPQKISVIRKYDPPNPYFSEQYEPINTSMNNMKTFKGHLMGVTSLSYNPKKDILATGSDDTTWKLWSIPSGDLIMSGEGHQDWVGGVSFHPKGNQLATASGDGCVKIWDFLNARCQTTYSEHGQPVWKCEFHDSGDFLISCSMDHSIKLWDMVQTKASRFTFRGHVDSVNSINWQPYSCMFVSGSGDKTVSLWDIRTNLCVQTFYGHNNAVNSVKFNQRGDLIVSGDCDGINKVWDIRMVKESRQFDSGLSSSNCAIFDKSNKFVLVANEDTSIKIFDMTTGEKTNELKGHEDAVLDLVWDNSKEGLLISASSDCSFKLWQ